MFLTQCILACFVQHHAIDLCNWLADWHQGEWYILLPLLLARLSQIIDGIWDARNASPCVRELNSRPQSRKSQLSLQFRFRSSPIALRPTPCHVTTIMFAVGRCWWMEPPLRRRFGYFTRSAGKKTPQCRTSGITCTHIGLYKVEYRYFCKQFVHLICNWIFTLIDDETRLGYILW